MSARLEQRTQWRSPQWRGNAAENVIRLSRTRKIDVQPEVLAAHGILVPGQVGTPNVHAPYIALGGLVSRYAQRHKLNSLMVTSPASGAGTTVTVINLALQLARQVNRTVLAVDLNLRAPAIHRYFGFTPECGMAECFRGDSPFEEILFSPAERLTVAPTCRAEEQAARLLSLPSTARLVEEITCRYPERLVVFDTPPILERDDVLGLLPAFDASLLVVQSGKTQADHAQQALRYLRDTKNLGVVLNNPPHRPNPFA